MLVSLAGSVGNFFSSAFSGMRFPFQSSLFRGLFFRIRWTLNSEVNIKQKNQAKLGWPHLPTHKRKARNYGINTCHRAMPSFIPFLLAFLLSQPVWLLSLFFFFLFSFLFWKCLCEAKRAKFLRLILWNRFSSRLTDQKAIIQSLTSLFWTKD